MLEELEQKLRELNLTQNETKVYVSLIELGESKTGPLIKHSKIGSGRIYEILDSLISKGLISYVSKNNVKHYKALSLENISKYIETKKNQLDQIKNNIDLLIPRISQGMNKEQGTIVEVFEGIEGIKTAFSKQLDFAKNEILYCWGIDSVELYDKKVIDFFKFNHFKKRKHYVIKKIMHKFCKNQKDLKEKSTNKYIDYQNHSDIEIIGDLTIIFIHQTNNLAITIKNEDLANSLKSAFNELWGSIKN